MKRLITLIMAIVMMLSATAALADLTTESPIRVIPDAKARIVPEGEDVTLTIFGSLQPNTLESYSREVNLTTQLIEKDTGLKLEFIEAPAHGADAKLNLLLNSGSYPDIIMYKGIKKAAMDQYAQSGIFVALDDYISEELRPTRSTFSLTTPPPRRMSPAPTATSTPCRITTKPTIVCTAKAARGTPCPSWRSMRTANRRPPRN